MPKLQLKSIKTAVRICYTKKIDEKYIFLVFSAFFIFVLILAKDNFFFEKVGL